MRALAADEKRAGVESGGCWWYERRLVVCRSLRLLGLLFAGLLLAALVAGGSSATGPKSAGAHSRGRSVDRAPTATPSVSGSVLAWGCGGGNDFGQCAVPVGAGSGVTAIAAGYSQSLALKWDGSGLGRGCRAGGAGQG